jgi:hypothetical protein
MTQTTATILLGRDDRFMGGHRFRADFSLTLNEGFRPMWMLTNLHGQDTTVRKSVPESPEKILRHAYAMFLREIAPEKVPDLAKTTEALDQLLPEIAPGVVGVLTLLPTHGITPEQIEDIRNMGVHLAVIDTQSINQGFPFGTRAEMRA